MTHLDIQELANLTAGDADVENFERLFTKLKEMKGDWLLNRWCVPNQQRRHIIKTSCSWHNVCVFPRRQGVVITTRAEESSRRKGK